MIARWQEFDQPIYHGGADPSLFLTLTCTWKLIVENYCETYHLLFIHPSLNSYSGMEDHYNILDSAGLAGQGTTTYQPKISADGRRFPRFSNLPAICDEGAEYVALFPNVILELHKDHHFNIFLSPDGSGRTSQQVEIYYAYKVALGEDYVTVRAINTEMWKKVFCEDI